MSFVVLVLLSPEHFSQTVLSEFCFSLCPPNSDPKPNLHETIETKPKVTPPNPRAHPVRLGEISVLMYKIT